MILALETSEIAAHCGYGKRGRPRIKMKYRLLFNGVHIQGDRTAVYEGIKYPFSILSHSTQSPFRWGDHTSMVAKNALHLSIL
jgi:hypothetical protein